MELAPGYLPAAYDIVRKAGGLCIADEVQTGFGRTGSNYWGFQNQGVTPDIVTLAKVSNLLSYFGLLFLLNIMKLEGMIVIISRIQQNFRASTLVEFVCSTLLLM